MAGATTGHQWLTPNGRYSFVAVEGPGSLAIVDNRTGLTAATYPYPGGGKPHGMFFEPSDEGDDASPADLSHVGSGHDLAWIVPLPPLRRRGRPG